MKNKNYEPNRIAKNNIQLIRHMKSVPKWSTLMYKVFIIFYVSIYCSMYVLCFFFAANSVPLCGLFLLSCHPAIVLEMRTESTFFQFNSQLIKGLSNHSKWAISFGNSKCCTGNSTWTQTSHMTVRIFVCDVIDSRDFLRTWKARVSFLSKLTPKLVASPPHRWKATKNIMVLLWFWDCVRHFFHSLF